MEISKTKEISSELDVVVDVDGSSVRIEAIYEGKLGGGGVYINTDLYKLIDKLTDAIPGEWDDALIDPLIKKLTTKK